MSYHALVRPLSATIAATGIAPAWRAMTPEPKEVAVAGSAGAIAITIDFGSVVQLDNVFIGFTNADAATPLQLSYGVAGPWATAVGGARAALPTRLRAPRRHYLWQLEAPVAARYIGIAGNVPAGFQIGVIAAGEAFRPEWGPELGHGRGVIETGSATRRPDGGFGIVKGVRAPTWQWTLGDLSDDERDELYALIVSQGETETLLVIEGGDSEPPLAESVHWSLLTRVEPYERNDPGMTRWALRLQDWA